MAIRRFSAALDQLDEAAETIVERTQAAGIEAVMEAGDESRRKLAQELDAAMRQNRALEKAAEEVAMRIGKVGSTLRRLLHDEPPREIG